MTRVAPGHATSLLGPARVLGAPLVLWLAALGLLQPLTSRAADTPVEVRVQHVLERTPLIDGHNDLPWEIRERFGGDAPPPSARAELGVAEAYAILGLAPGADEAAIRAAHHRLMQQLHPDHGGSGYLATQINRARDLLLDRTVAVKTLHPHLAGTPYGERFLQEGQTLASLTHPNLVMIYDMGRAGGLPYLVMEYIPGESLAALIERAAALLRQREASESEPEPLPAPLEETAFRHGGPELILDRGRLASYGITMPSAAR